ncbi:serine-rich adhesin for platelets isoform X2 [Anabrus simplex]|uniref:serine-rich adhesin for platelets isoform X2 n=1 Tax=Anabrus simplex TaxID=316456 RepID=UPI0035A3D493
MGRLSFSENKKTMKTEPCKGTQVIPASLDNRSRSDNEKNNNNTIDITSLVNRVNNITLKPSNMGLREPGSIRIEHESNENKRDNGSNIVTTELIPQLSNIKIAEEASIELDKEKTDTCVVDNRSDVKEGKHGKDNEEAGETVKAELCCRGPARSDFLSEQRSKSSPYQIHLSSRNRTDCGGVVYVGQSDIGPTEETVSIDQLQASLFEDNQQQSSPPFQKQELSPGHNIFSDDELLLLKHVNDVMKDPKLRADMVCTYLKEGSERYSETPSPLGVPGSSPVQHMTTSSDLQFPERSFSEQYLSQGSPQQVVPTLYNWQDSIQTPSTSSSYSSSNPTSPSDVSSLGNPANAYLTEDFNDMLGKPPNSLEVDFSVPNHPVMDDYVDSFMSRPQTLVTDDVNLLSPNGYGCNLSPQTTTSITNEANLLSPNGYTSNLSPQTTTTSISDEASLLSPNGYTSNLSPQSTTSVTSEVNLLSPSGYTSSVSPQVTTLMSDPIHILSSNGYRHNISPQTVSSVANKNCMSSNTLGQNSQNSELTLLQTKSSVTNQFLVSANGYTPKNNNLASTSPQATYGQSTFNILIPVLRPQVQQQPLNRPRPRLILPARKETNVPSREEILQRLDRKKKKNAWLRVNLKSKEEVTRGDADGDTLLMIAVTREHDNLYELVYALVEYMRRHVPEALNIKNNFGQTALYNACIELPQHPLIARYLAETLLSLNVNIAEDKYGSGWSLVECVKRRGESHSGVLSVLLNLKTAQGKPVFSL